MEHEYDELDKVMAMSFYLNAYNVVVAFAEAHPDAYETADAKDIYKWYREQITEKDK